MIIVIPAFQPDEKLIKFIDELRKFSDCSIVIVNDGSDESALPFFDLAEKDQNSIVLHHDRNRGKGRALKTAFEYIKNSIDCEPNECIITVDADGQYSPESIALVQKAYRANPDALVLGGRNFAGGLNFGRRIAYGITRIVFAMTTGVRIYDTQTGLRGFAAERIDEMLEIAGERYEYENNQLLHCTKPNKKTIEVRVECPRSDNKKTSHFNPLRDARRIYFTIFSFIGTSFSSWLVDYTLLLILASVFTKSTGGVGVRIGSITLEPKLIAIIISRTVGSLMNFLLNRKVVFRSGTKWCIFKYFANVAVMLCLNYILLRIITAAGVPLAIAAILAQLIVYPLNFISQRKFVFGKRYKGSAK